MSITVKRLHKLLGEMIEAGHGRKTVFVNKASFTDNREVDGVLILPVEAVEGPVWVSDADDDGGTKWNKDGSEAGRNIVILKGGAS